MFSIREKHTGFGQLGIFCFNFACAIAPLFLAPSCELVGRRVIYVGTYAYFVIVLIELTLGNNITAIFVMRAPPGLFGYVETILVEHTVIFIVPIRRSHSCPDSLLLLCWLLLWTRYRLPSMPGSLMKQSAGDWWKRFKDCQICLL